MEYHHGKIQMWRKGIANCMCTFNMLLGDILHESQCSCLARRMRGVHFKVSTSFGGRITPVSTGRAWVFYFMFNSVIIENILEHACPKIVSILVMGKVRKWLSKKFNGQKTLSNFTVSNTKCSSGIHFQTELKPTGGFMFSALFLSRNINVITEIPLIK